jgi:hypothetical protein
VNWNTQWNAAATFVTGSQNIKVGYQGAVLIDQRKNFSSLDFLSYRTNNGIPDQITETINRFPIRQSVRFDSFYVQDQKTLGRMTLQGGLRYDHAWSYFPEQTVGPVRFFPTPVTYPARRASRAITTCGRGRRRLRRVRHGKTSIKFNVGRYLEAAQNGGLFIALNPTGPSLDDTTRTWTDANRNYSPTATCRTRRPGSDARGSAITAARTRAPTSARRSSTRRSTRLLSGGACVHGDWQ